MLQALNRWADPGWASCAPRAGAPPPLLLRRRRTVTRLKEFWYKSKHQPVPPSPLDQHAPDSPGVGGGGGSGGGGCGHAACALRPYCLVDRLMAMKSEVYIGKGVAQFKVKASCYTSC